MSFQHDGTTAVPVPVGPPWSLDAVADVHAGVFDPELTARLLAEMAKDPEAAELLAALGSVVDELSLLPPLPMPQHYAARLDAAIAAEAANRVLPQQRQLPVVQTGLSQLRDSPTSVPDRPGQLPRVGGPQVPPSRPLSAVGPGPAGPAGPPPPAIPPTTGGSVSSLEEARARRRRRSIIGGLGIAAAVATIATVTLTSLNRPQGMDGAAAVQRTTSVSAPATAQSSQTPLATMNEPSPTGRPGFGPGSSGGQALSIDDGDLQRAFDQVNGKTTGRMKDAILYAACAGAADISGARVLGVSDATYQSQPVIVWALSVPGDDSKAELVIVASDCGSSGAQVLRRTEVDRH